MIRIASIDIGSNAIRLFVGQANAKGNIQVLDDRRAPVRLGADAFTQGYITPATYKKLENTLQQFSIECRQLDVHQISAVATAAVRDSRNGRRLIKRIHDNIGIRIRLLSGNEEAKMIHLAVTHELNLKQKKALLMDVGGGSAEFVLSLKDKMQPLGSFPIGTVRLLAEVGPDGNYLDYAVPIRQSLQKIRKACHRHESPDLDFLIGTGGNLRAMGRLAQKLGLSTTRNRFNLVAVQELTAKLLSMSIRERMIKLKLKKDRADVILPATILTLETMHFFSVQQTLVPDVGLRNGLFLDTLNKIRGTKP